MDSVSYLSQGKFHKSILCKRTQTRVTYALIGDWDNQHHYYHSPRQSIAKEVETRPIILYVLPSGCSRYMGVLLDGIVTTHGLRMVAIDRPGAGGTPSCPGTHRMQISTQHISSILDHIGYGNSKGKISILTHSAGWFYALNLLSERADLFTCHTKIAFSSPFIPTLFSGNIILSLLPKSIVQLAPSASSILQACGNSLAWSAGIGQEMGLLNVEKTSKDESSAQKKIKDDDRIRRKSQARLPSARFHPPYEPHSTLSFDAAAECEPAIHPRTGRKVKDGQSLLFEYFISEGGAKAATEDFLYCLGKVDGMDNVTLNSWTEEKLKQLASERSSDSSILIIWCEKDFMIPLKGRSYMDQLLQKSGLSAEKWVMAQGGHDAGIISKQVMDDVLSYLATSV